MPLSQKPTDNHLLAALPPDARKRVYPHLKLVNLPFTTVVYESGQNEDYVYFPTSCIISLLYVMIDGTSAEIAVIGNEGIAGIAVFMGGDSMISRAVVQSSGYAFRMPAPDLRKEFDAYTEMRMLMLRYTQSLITQMAQTAVCNRHHSIEQQLCRLLLLSLDRLSGNHIEMTQEFIASMLGVRREGITAAASKLQKIGVIAYKRGHIDVLDRQKMEALSCECYQVVKRETDRLLAFTSPMQGHS